MLHLILSSVPYIKVYLRIIETVVCASIPVERKKILSDPVDLKYTFNAHVHFV